MGRITSFRELQTYQLGFALAMEIYRITRSFPAEERFALVSQARRSSRSVCANIGEAWRRRRYPAAFVAKLTDAEAEATESRVHLDFALACGYLSRDDDRDLDSQYDILIGKLVRMIDQADSWAVGQPDEPAGLSRAGSRAGARKAKRARKPNPPPAPSPPRRGGPEGGLGPGNVVTPGPTPTSLEPSSAADDSPGRSPP